MEHTILFYPIDFALATLPAVGVAMRFATPVRYLPLVAFGGGFTHLTRVLIMDWFGIHIGKVLRNKRYKRLKNIFLVNFLRKLQQKKYLFVQNGLKIIAK